MFNKKVMTKLDRFTALAKKVANFDKLPTNVKDQFDNRAANVFCFNDLKDQEITEATAEYYLAAIIDYGGERQLNDGIEKINQLIEEYDFPIKIELDVKQRLEDWLVSGGQPTDSYVWQQVRCLENCIKYGFAKHKVVNLGGEP